MVQLDDVITLIESKVDTLVRVAQALMDEKQRLKQQVEELSERLSEKEEEIKGLESKYQSLKLTKSLASSAEDVKNVKLQVNRIVREIDKCIALLNK